MVICEAPLFTLITWTICGAARVEPPQNCKGLSLRPQLFPDMHAPSTPVSGKTHAGLCSSSTMFSPAEIPDVLARVKSVLPRVSPAVQFVETRFTG